MTPSSSSSSTKSLRIWWDASVQAYRLTSPFNRDLVDALKTAIPVSDRSFDPQTKVWTITEKFLQPVLDLCKVLRLQPTVLTRQQYDAARAGSTTSGSGAGNSVTHVAVNTVDRACIDFMRLLPQDAALSAYRKAAMLLHPDRGGDMEKMSQLNALWTLLEKELWRTS